MVGITSAVVVWPSGVEPLPPKPDSGMGRPPVMPRRTAKRQPVSVKALAQSLPDSAFQNISWREGTNERLTGRFAALRVRCAGGNVGKARLLPQQWLLIEWPADQAEPEKYYLSTLPETTALNDLVRAAHMRWRWRIERDYQDLKQGLGLGLGHYEWARLARLSPPRQPEHRRVWLPDGAATESRQQHRRQKKLRRTPVACHCRR